MSKELLTRTFTAALVVVAFIIATTGPASAASFRECSAGRNNCYQACDRLKTATVEGFKKWRECSKKCNVNVETCIPRKMEPAKERVSTSTTEPPKRPGKDTGVLNPVNVGGVKQPSSTSMNSLLKGRGLRDKANVSGDKQVDGSGSRPTNRAGLHGVNLQGMNQRGDNSGSQSGLSKRKR